jgi:hypothetical protein
VKERKTDLSRMEMAFCPLVAAAVAQKGTSAHLASKAVAAPEET